MPADGTNKRARGAWYTDPFGSDTQERWWDGTKWTKNVRDKLPGSASPAVRMAARPAAQPLAVAQVDAANAGIAFPLGLFDVVGETLRLQSVVDQPAMGLELVRGSERRVALVKPEWGGELARMACSAGEWRLLKRRRLGWELIIENSDGHVVGWYSGRRWRAGGVIILRAGPQLDLVNSLAGRWTLRTVDQEEPIMRLHGRSLPLRVELVSAPRGLADLEVAVLTACAVRVLDALAAPPPRGGP